MNDKKSQVILTKIESLAQQPGFYAYLLIFIVSDMLYSVEEAVQINWRSRVSNQEATLLVRYMVKRPILDNSELTQSQISITSKEVRGATR